MNIEKALKTAKYTDKVVVVSSDMLIDLQKHLLRMIEDVSAVLDKYDIKWTLSGGNILGAVRHEGFIPWDDDIDIFIEREEFNKLKNVFDSELSDRYELKLPGDNDYLLHFPRIEDKKCRIKSIQSKGEDDNGLFIDVFILENTYNNTFLRTINGIICSALLFIDSCIRMDLCKDNMLYYTDYDETVKKAVNSRARFAFLFKFLSFQKWLLISDKYFGHIKAKSNFVVCPSGGGHFFGETYNRKKMIERIKVPFNHLQLYIPKDYDHYLSIRYGKGYMEIPPENKRERHVFAKLDLKD